MAVNPVSMNGTTFYPTSVDLNPMRIRDERRARSGAARIYDWGIKNRWSLEWRGVTESVANAIRTIGTLAGTFVYIDTDGTSYTVYVPAGGWSQSISAERRSLANVYYLDVTLKLEEA